MKIIFAGTPEFAATALKGLIESEHDVCLVLTQPDRASGRGMKLTPSAVKALALAHDIPVATPVTLSLKKGGEEAQKAQDAARALFAQGGDRSNMPTTTLTDADLSDGKLSVVDLMVKCGLAPSKGEARRLIQQGGVEINGEKVIDTTAVCKAEAMRGEGLTVKKGKKVFHRILLA